MSRRLLIEVAVLLIAVAVLGYHTGRLKRRAELAASPAPEPTAPLPEAGPQEPVTIYVPSDQDGLLHERQATATVSSDRNARAREVLRALVAVCREKDSPHPLAPAADVDAVFLLPDGLAVVDANAALAQGQSSGILAEELTVAAMAQTLAANVPGITRIKLLVDGKDTGTLAGHLDLNAAYDVASFKDWVSGRTSEAR